MYIDLAFRLELDLQQGVQTATAVSPDQCWAVSGTSSGYLTCWDLRFRLPIVKCKHPSGESGLCRQEKSEHLTDYFLLQRP